MSRYLIAIDPSTKAVGYAIYLQYRENTLVAAGNCSSSKRDRVARTIEITEKFKDVLNYHNPEVAVFEDPMLRGKANSSMQRIIGALELTLFNAGIAPDNLYYYNPGTVKKQVAGDGRADKFEVALSSGDLLKTDKEKELLAKLIDEEDFDGCDAVAVGLTHFKVTKNA